MAWLCASPKKIEKVSRPKIRLDTLKKDSTALSLPDAPPYIVKCFDLLGRCSNRGMGRSPFSWLEIESFSNQSGYKLTGWESEQLIKMSREYCNMSSEAEDIDCLPPYREGSISDDKGDLQRMRDNVDKQLDKFFK